MDTTKKTSSAKPKGLAADLRQHAPGVDVLRWYWIGAFPTCTGEGLTLGGISFPKLTEKITPGRKTASGKTQRLPQIGSLARLNKNQIDKIRGVLPMRVIRFLEPASDGQQREATDESPRRKGYPVRIPTEKALAEARETGRGIQRYDYQEGDEPAARYVFAALCPNQDDPVRGSTYPPSLEDQDINWPE